MANGSKMLEELTARADAMAEDLGYLLEWAKTVDEARSALEARVTELEGKVGARNKSAPTRRNMTDEDALAVLEGDQKDMAHKDAADARGISYAQVYSCRLEYTFKHVHKILREKGFKNPWTR